MALEQEGAQAGAQCDGTSAGTSPGLGLPAPHRAAPVLSPEIQTLFTYWFSLWLNFKFLVAFKPDPAALPAPWSMFVYVPSFLPSLNYAEQK